MIEVDISNIWGRVSLPDLLGLEARVAAAHSALPAMPEMLAEESVKQILTAAEQIREENDVLVVLGSCPGVRGAVEAIQGRNRNFDRKPRIFFGGDDLSTRAWNDLMHRLEGKDFSLCMTEPSLEAAVAFRSLRWLLERKYGTEEAQQRLFAPAGHASWDEGWVRLDVSPEAMGLLPMAVAGLDIRAFLEGVAASREAFDLRSYENPVWLHGGVRTMLCRSGRTVELLCSCEPGFEGLGHWWQGCFGGCGGPVPALGKPTFPEGDASFVTALCFAPGKENIVIAQDVKDREGLGELAGKTLAQVQQQRWQEVLDTWADKDIPVLRVECGDLTEKTLGELYVFFRLSSAVCSRMWG